MSPKHCTFQLLTVFVSLGSDTTNETQIIGPPILQILGLGGYATYAAMLQATIDKLVECTVGEQDQARPQTAQTSRPQPYVLGAFYIWVHHGELTSFQMCNSLFIF